jgi:hypothetical protein
MVTITANPAKARTGKRKIDDLNLVDMFSSFYFHKQRGPCLAAGIRAHMG